VSGPGYDRSLSAVILDVIRIVAFKAAPDGMKAISLAVPLQPSPKRAQLEIKTVAGAMQGGPDRRRHPDETSHLVALDCFL
jgi:hypothetical protein